LREWRHPARPVYYSVWPDNNRGYAFMSRLRWTTVNQPKHQLASLSSSQSLSRHIKSINLIHINATIGPSPQTRNNTRAPIDRYTTTLPSYHTGLDWTRLDRGRKGHDFTKISKASELKSHRLRASHKSYQDVSQQQQQKMFDFATVFKKTANSQLTERPFDASATRRRPPHHKHPDHSTILRQRGR
jgi:hypothetical protein